MSTRTRPNSALVLALALLIAIAGGAGYCVWTESALAAENAAPAKLYYCPMHPSYTSNKPGQCPICNMDLVPVVEKGAAPAGKGEPAGHTAIMLDLHQRQMIGVQIGTVEKRQVSKTIRAVGRVDYDERTLSVVSLKFGGWVEELMVKSVGEPVAKGQPLFSIYSPELLEAQRNYLLARDSARILGEKASADTKGMAFGREFDSLADLVSFGVAPAFMVYRIVLDEFPRTGWMVAAVYLACGALRLARFNILSMRGASSNEFVGFPIPSAAAMVVSVTMFMIWLQERGIIAPIGTPEHPLGPWRYALPVVMLLLSVMMVSTVKYPTFKHVDWTMRKSLATFVAALVVLFLALQWPQVTLAALFVCYLIYGMVRPWVSKRLRKEIENEEDESETS